VIEGGVRGIAEIVIGYQLLVIRGPLLGLKGKEGTAFS